MGTVKFHTWLNNQVQDIELESSTITEFGIRCFEVNTAKGRFSKFGKRGFIIAGGTIYPCAYHFIPQLKRDFFKGKIGKIHRQTHTRTKYNGSGRLVGERKATDWRYEVKPVIA